MESGRLRYIENLICRSVLKVLQLKALREAFDDTEHVNESINSTAEGLRLTTEFSTSGCEIATSGGNEGRARRTALGIKGDLFAISWNSCGMSRGGARKRMSLCNLKQ